MTGLRESRIWEEMRWWVALVVPPLVWGGRLLAGWTIGEVACNSGWEDSAGYVVTQTLVTVVALTLVLASGWVALSALNSEGRPVVFDPPEAHPFLGVSGVLSAVMFGLLVIVEGSAVYVVSC